MLKPESNPDKPYDLKIESVPSVQPYTNSNIHLGRFGLVLFISCLFVLPFAGLGFAAEKNRQSLPDKKIKVPEFFGLYALIGKNSVELKEKSPPLEVDEQVEFILYDQNLGDFKGEWQVAGVLFNEGKWGKQGGWRCRIKPVAGNPLMIRIVPEEVLPPGVYMIKNVSKKFGRESIKISREFIIQREIIIKSMLKGARQTIKQRLYDSAIKEAKRVQILDPGNAEAKKVIADAQQEMKREKVEKKKKGKSREKK